MNDNLVDNVKKYIIGFQKNMLCFNQKYLNKLNKKLNEKYG